MGRRVRAIIYYDSQIGETEIGPIFVSAQYEDLAFNQIITLKELRYEIFEIVRDIELETMIQSHYSSGNVVLELYAHFVDVDECDLGLRKFLPNSTLDQENLHQWRGIHRFHPLITTLEDIRPYLVNGPTTHPYNILFIRTDNQLSKTWIGKATSHPRHAIGVDNEGELVDKKNENGFKSIMTQYKSSGRMV
ncbi:hypothetical protein J1N35_001839 [Gossypium stocksii]|uniref:Uncharacterized protein n=1 Tax=Gossypium stocksii TaxID=47602 RepID=A0A9D3WL83_9ROSI|nr:hypothetical protein J1N35_001839 [Gossypium stocksii]